MTTTPAAKPSRGLTELLGKALTDHDLRERLFADPEATGRDFDLSDADHKAIKTLDRAKFEHAATELANRQDWTVKVQVSKSF